MVLYSFLYERGLRVDGMLTQGRNKQSHKGLGCSSVVLACAKALGSIPSSAPQNKN